MNPSQPQQLGQPGQLPQQPGRPAMPGMVPGPQYRNQDMNNIMNMQHRQQEQMQINKTLQPQIIQIDARLRAAKTNQERELVFSDLKRNPSLFHAWLRAHGRELYTNGPFQGPAPQMQNPQQQQHQ
uniref:GRF1-interacting factor 3 n=1 Tax=Caenorhabditis tropicalis TaxID=1561998 RepID=A0A1I7UH48_9PELO